MKNKKGRPTGLFPFDVVRESQKQLMEEIEKILADKKDLIVHAPTGIGKTVAALAPALEYAKKNSKTVFFLTSRHTQHNIAIETLKIISRKHDLKINATDIIGRKWMCLQPNVDSLNSGEFAEYCKSIREGGKCEFYQRTKKNNKLTVEAKKTLADLKGHIMCSGDKVEECKKTGVCAYEIAMHGATDSEIMIGDYNYIFEPFISDLFFSKADKKLEDSIIIIDEGHNLPDRLRQQATSRLTTTMLKRALSEAIKYGYDETHDLLRSISDILKKMGRDLKIGDEKLTQRNIFTALIQESISYDQLANDLEGVGNEIREAQKRSYVSGIATFLQNFVEHDKKGFSTVISCEKGKNDEKVIMLANHCLDPSIISRSIIKRAHSTILMSGTLTPTEMYADVLGFDNPVQKVYENPFPEKNKLNIIVPKTTTKFTQRNERQYEAIAEECAKIINNVPGNTIIFFPSYYLKDRIKSFLDTKSIKTVFDEQPNMSTDDKNSLLARFKEYKDIGAVLNAVISGNFYEGVDLPGDLLKCVVIVGLPLQQPDLRTKELIGYYDKKFGKGWDYGYVFPAFNKTLQSAGRCIRSETDKGIVVFLDERYLWPNYKRCFPQDMHFNVTNEPKKLIEYFFNNV